MPYLEVAKIDEKPRTHVLLDRVHFGGVTFGLVAAYDQITVFEQTTAAYFLGTPRRDQFGIEMVQSFAEFAVLGLGQNRWEKVGREFVVVVVIDGGGGSDV